MINETTKKLQQLISELSSTPEDGSLCYIEKVCARLVEDVRCSKPTEDELWSGGREHIVRSLLCMPADQRIKVLQEMPEYKELLKTFKGK